MSQPWTLRSKAQKSAKTLSSYTRRIIKECSGLTLRSEWFVPSSCHSPPCPSIMVSRFFWGPSNAVAYLLWSHIQCGLRRTQTRRTIERLLNSLFSHKSTLRSGVGHIEMCSPFPLTLGLVHGFVCSMHQLLFGECMLWKHSDPHTRPNRNGLPMNGHWL